MLSCDALLRNGRTPAQGRPVYRCAIISARRRQAQITHRRSSLRRPANTRGADVLRVAPMTMLRVLARSSCALAFVAAPVLAAEPPITVLTSSVYYPLGVALAENIGKTMSGIKTSVQTTKASAENLNLLQAGRGEIAFTLGDSLSDA